MIGSYAGISFTVSEDKVQTFQEMSRETASRWNTHEVIGAKPKQEFLGPDLDSMTFTMQLSAWGVSALCSWQNGCGSFAAKGSMTI